MTGDIYEGLRHFSRWEFGQHADRMQTALLVKLDKTRDAAGFPFHISSGFRDNDEKSHGRGYAVDISIDPVKTGVSRSRARHEIVSAAVGAGFTRIGVYDRHVHLDCDPSLPPRVIWIGESS